MRGRREDQIASRAVLRGRKAVGCRPMAVVGKTIDKKSGRLAS